MRFGTVPLGWLFWKGGRMWFKVEPGYALPLIVTRDPLVRTAFAPKDVVTPVTVRGASR